MHALPRPDQQEVKGTSPGLQVPFHRAAVGEEEAQAMSEVIRSGWLTMGTKTLEFEAQFGRYVGAKHAVAVCSGCSIAHSARGNRSST
jgi:dTDP-4-amino-4,6-dideoxygalactose transaminase